MRRRRSRDSRLEEALAFVAFVGSTAVALILVAGSVALAGIRLAVEDRRAQRF
jgi:hypothetical protein